MDFKQKIITELHRPARKNYPRRNVVIKGLLDLFQADIIEMKPYSKVNKGFNYILNVIDRFNRTIKTIIFKQFSLRGTHKWDDILQDIVRGYNTSFHRTIGMKPSEVNKKKRITCAIKN